MSDAKGALVLLAELPATKRLIGDTGYRAMVRHRSKVRGEGRSAARRVESLKRQRLHPGPQQAEAPRPPQQQALQKRCRIDNAFARLTDWRGIGMRLTPDAATCSSP
jgi:hypothetical protein